MLPAEASQRAAILNALPAHVALINAKGAIVSVNDAWHAYSGHGVFQGPGYPGGTNYLAICDAATARGSDEARLTAEGVRAVLYGVVPRFSIEYACGPAPEARCFLFTATPLSSDRPSGAVIMFVDVTQERSTQKSLRVSEARFRQMAQHITDVFFLRSIDSSTMYYVSPAYEQIWGRTCESLYANPGSWADSMHPADRARVLTEFKRGRNTGFDCEYRIVRPDGGLRWIQVRGFPILDDNGVAYRTAGVSTDITARKESDEKVRRLNRVHAMLTGVNAAIVRVRDRNALFGEACRIAVEAGTFTMAWIGVIDRQTLEGKVVACFGEHAEYANNIVVTARQDASGNELPANRALRMLEPVVCNNIATDLSLRSVRDGLLRNGHKSAGYFPLAVGGRPDAVVALFSGETEFFDREETQLLRDLADNLSFALEHLAGLEKLNYVAFYDSLTGLANRRLFLERVTQYIRSAAGGANKIALLLMDLERFKNINDTFGRPAGDELLKQVAQWLTANIGEADLMARVGPDQFAIVLPNLLHEDVVARLLEKSMAIFLDHPFELSGSDVFRVAAKVGVAFYPDDAETADTLFRNAESALKKAQVGGERYLFYAQKMTETVAGRLVLDYQLRHAIDNHEFELHYQPKIHLATGKLTGAEALIRWNDPRSGLVLPGKFISILEETGLIMEVGRWVLRKAIQEHSRWRDAGLNPVRIAVNVSPMQLRTGDFVDDIRNAIAANPLAAAGLELEITEGLIMEDVKHTIGRLKAIRAMGVTIAIDDFGTGFSSLNYLAKLPADTLKIDRSFISDMTTGPDAMSLVSAIINLAHSLKLKVVAEGVETDEQMQLLRSLQCDEIQGFFFSRPVRGDVFETRFLRDNLA